MESQLSDKHQHAACARCHRTFECRVGSINFCQCQSIQLTDDQQQYIRSTYQGCLCADCLLAVRTEYNHLIHPL
ncbi:hypothetical protein GO730_15805 [Spirosoma sp. HMF3257]|uniref:Cysteine-rich CWC family protein n=1 Tax=Spirosoma telluris TaxID=2183553 RepID=A0A327NJF9_9BACT|nr:hypothetical protein [Spirosoma telluris]RAI75272.1 hypothetical protein HMF3257_15755 [Spirosoma telluris]